MTQKLFGTDGIRGITGERISAGVVFRVGKAVAVFCRVPQEKPRILVGKDTRTSGDMLESALCSGLTAFGADVVKIGIVPTPSLPYLVKKTKASAGIMITASHNPPEYNGLKIFNSNGDKLSRDEELKIEEIVEHERDYLPNSYENLGNIIIDEDLLKLYADYVLQQTENINLNGMRVYLDCCNGAAYRVAPYVFKTLGASVKTINAKADGRKINVECGSQHPEALQKAVVAEKFDIGFCFDGDADRVIAVDGLGNARTGDDFLYCFARYFKAEGKLNKDTVAGTVMTNFGLEAALNESGIKLIRTPVGDKYVKKLMQEQTLSIGGEDSGHMILADHNFTSDGILAALFLTKIIKHKGVTLEHELKNFKKFAQAKLDVPVNELNKNKILSEEKVKAAIEESEAELLDSGRIVVRPSGTENIIRIMVEGEDMKQNEKLARTIEKTIKEASR